MGRTSRAAMPKPYCLLMESPRLSTHITVGAVWSTADTCSDETPKLRCKQCCSGQSGKAGPGKDPLPTPAVTGPQNYVVNTAAVGRGGRQDQGRIHCRHLQCQITQIAV